MNKIRNTVVILPLVFLTLFSSCNDWLTLEPQDGVIKENYWNTKEEVYASLLGCYSSLLTSGAEMRMFLWGELRGETMLPNLINSDAQAIMDGDIVSTNSLTEWSLLYTTINQCNTLIDYAPKAQLTDASFTDVMLAQYQAEAVALRSLMYFYLVRTFRDVPYVTKAIVSDDQKLQTPKTAGSAILDSLAIGLEEASKYIATSYGTDAATNKGRFTAYGVYSLLADIYLWKEDYEGCVRNCNKVINSGQLSLLYADNSHRFEIYIEDAISATIDTMYNVNESDVNVMFDRLYVQGNCDESIFEIQRERDFPNSDYWTLFQPSGNFYANMAALNELYFLPSEKDRSVYDIRTEGFSYKGNFIWKYIGLSREGAALLNLRTRETMECNTIVYRLAEIYLMRAEAKVQQAKIEEAMGESASARVTALLESAWSDVKRIRDRANATETTDLCYGIINASDLTTSTMEKFVYEERVREMLYEGKRWFDALRHAKRNNYEGNNMDYLRNMAIYSASASKVSSLQTKLKNKDFHYLPISQTEIDANNELIQNPFYN